MPAKNDQKHSHWGPIGAAAILFAGLLVLGFSSTAASPKEVELRQRAAKVFTYDRNVKSLSFNQLAALSMALEFKDLDGAEILVTSLERSMR